MNLLNRSLVASALSCMALGAVAQDLIFNGSFEFPASGGQFCYANASVGGWASSGAAQSCYLSNLLPNPWPDAVDGTQYLYLGQNLASNVTLSQPVLLESGVGYALTFYLAGLGQHPGASVVVSVEGQVSSVFSIPDSDSTWQRHQVTFTSNVAGNRTLSFVSPSGGAVNIDSVSLLATPVPEPATAALGMLGLAALALRLRARRRAGCAEALA